MLSDVFLHILPHAFQLSGHDHGAHEHGAHDHDHDHGSGHSHGDQTNGLLLLAGVVGFAVLDRFTAWISEQGPQQRIRSAAYLNLAADALHNIADGMAIAAAFLSSTKLGRTTVIAVWLHELPQELGDFAVLTSCGLSRFTALVANFVCGLMALFGTAFVIIVGLTFADTANLILPIAAGGMLYTTLSCVMPEALANDPGGPSFGSKVQKCLLPHHDPTRSALLFPQAHETG